MRLHQPVCPSIFKITRIGIWSDCEWAVNYRTVFGMWCDMHLRYVPIITHTKTVACLFARFVSFSFPTHMVNMFLSVSFSYLDSLVMQCSTMLKRKIYWIATLIWWYWTVHFRNVLLVWCMHSVYHSWWSTPSAFTPVAYRWLAIRHHIQRHRSSSVHSPMKWIYIKDHSTQSTPCSPIQCIG